MSQLEWPVIIHELGLGHPMKFIWEERAKALITYPNFWKQFYRKFPQYREATVTAREFEAGEIHKAYVFVSGLGFSQLLFAWAAEDMKSRNWLGCHRRMYEWYGGVPHVTVPDCLYVGLGTATKGTTPATTPPPFRASIPTSPRRRRLHSGKHIYHRW
jgi:hypothetical protein